MSSEQSSSNIDVKQKTSSVQQIEDVKQNAVLNTILWVVSLALLFGASVANSQLPKYWVEANNVWVRIGVIVAGVVVALFLLYLTTQGKNFIRLLKESRIELRRVIWPTKQETMTSSWQVLVVIIITAILLWIFDTIFNLLMQLIIG